MYKKIYAGKTAKFLLERRILRVLSESNRSAKPLFERVAWKLVPIHGYEQRIAVGPHPVGLELIARDASRVVTGTEADPGAGPVCSRVAFARELVA